MVWLVIREPVRGDAEKTLLTVGVSLGWAVRRARGGVGFDRGVKSKGFEM